MTQLPNRAAVFDQMQQAVDRMVRQPAHQFAVLFMDFDRFKQVNATRWAMPPATSWAPVPATPPSLRWSAWPGPLAGTSSCCCSKALAADAPALVARVALLLAGDGLDADTVATVTSTVASISAASEAGTLNRVRAAIHLVLCAPDYLVQL